MEFERWDDFLIAEHEMIERAMAVLKECLDNLESTLEKPVRIIRALDFLLEFGDKIHNRKEEEHLFPLMQSFGVPVSGGPIGVMLQEHQMERDLIGSMIADIQGLGTASAEAKESYRQKGLEYLQVRAEHIWKENDVLYPMARNFFKGDENTTLLTAFQGINTETYGSDAHERFLAMVDEVEKALTNKQGLIHNLSYEQMEGIMETLPFEVTFVDAEDTVAYFNRLDREKLFPRTRSVIGRKVAKCHPEKSVDTVNTIVKGFKDKTLDKAEFWINFRDDKIMIRYFPVYNDAGVYMGVLEVTQSIGWLQKIEGEKRLLD